MIEYIFSERQMITRIIRIVSALALAGSLCACSSNAKKGDILTEANAPTLSKTVKGYELYSWKTNAGWAFLLLDATNTLSTFEDITSQPDTSYGEDEFIEKLKTLPKSEEIFWNLKRMKGFSLPPDGTIAKIDKFCDKKGIKLEVIRWE